jgi:hypothetical protein
LEGGWCVKSFDWWKKRREKEKKEEKKKKKGTKNLFLHSQT